jgi:hypothetical protein
MPSYDEMNERELLVAVAKHLATVAMNIEALTHALTDASLRMSAAAMLGKGDPGRFWQSTDEAIRAHRTRARRSERP